ncbi:MAG: HAMP domain-containing histidine kinase [Acidimicrobiia bacterium]|nr:HAMP domain-containing protein [Acidimicrobiia bacterium]NNF11175.1 HAMP domain-containing histidine kinase [Acidimicrobiia bacterium]NNL71441.1 HAMP domain-containing histidine kinase [Acidimicrobiia bacterium]
MKLVGTLRGRLIASYLAVVAVGSLAVWVVSRTIAPERFGRQIRAGRGAGAGGGAAQDLQDTVLESVDVALAFGVIAGLAAAALVGVVVSRRLLRSLASVRRATREMAAGDYQSRIPIPPERELAELAADVNTLGEALEETERRRTRLIGELAHELRTPLTTIGGYMEAFLDGVREPDPATFAAVADEARRLHRLADDLALLSRAEEGTLSLQLAETDLAELASRAAEYLRPQFDDQSVSLTVLGGEAHCVVDSDRIVQVFINLLGNAVVHTPAGGSVSIRTGETGSTVWAEVTDTGSGIPPDEIEQVFERFYRISGTDRPPGRGIGLTIARGIAQAHGGSLRATSPGPGRGATFTLSLPAA